MPCIGIGAEWGVFVTAGIGDAGLPQNSTGKGYARYTPTTAKRLSDAPADAGALTLPARAHHAIITIATNPVRIRTDGTAPTASEGLLIPAGTMLRVENQRMFLEQLRFIDTSAGASEVTVMYGWMP